MTKAHREAAEVLKAKEDRKVEKVEKVEAEATKADAATLEEWAGAEVPMERMQTVNVEAETAETAETARS